MKSDNQDSTNHGSTIETNDSIANGNNSNGDNLLLKALQTTLKGKEYEIPDLGKQVFYRSYSRTILDSTSSDGETQYYRKETFQEVALRTIQGLRKLGKLTDEEALLLLEMQLKAKCLTSGRWLWTGNTEWIEIPENYSGAFNCTSTEISDWKSFGLLMDLAMMGSGTGAVLEARCIENLPPILNTLNVRIDGKPGDYGHSGSISKTIVSESGNENAYQVKILVGDSRKGWVESYLELLRIASKKYPCSEIDVIVDLSRVRAAGQPLKGFGGVANPVKLPELYPKCAAILNRVAARKADGTNQLNSIECCLLIDEAAVTVVAGNIRRSAGIRQGNSEDESFALAKDNLWQQDANGNWRIDPDRDALRMANHTRVFHSKPTLEDVIDAVKKQYYSGEGAIQWAGEAVARANADLFWNRQQDSHGNKNYKKEIDERARKIFLNLYDWVHQPPTKIGGMLRSDKLQILELYVNQLYRSKYDASLSEEEIFDRLHRYGMNPCFAKGTKILTRLGDFPIEELESIGIPVDVWNGERWEPTEFKITGKQQPVFELIVENINSRTEKIVATQNHVFVLQDGTQKQLIQLNPGETLKVKEGLGFDYYRVVGVSYFGIEESVYCCTVSNHQFTLANGLIVGNCGEILMRNNHCNLGEIHLNQIEPDDWEDQNAAFKAGALATGSLLQRTFVEERYARSRELDPIVGVSFTGLFYFFTKAFGIAWLYWWQAGRPKTFGMADLQAVTVTSSDTPPINSLDLLLNVGCLEKIINKFESEFESEVRGIVSAKEWERLNLAELFLTCEKAYLNWWREIAEESVWEYCDRHALRRPNRCTTTQPAGSKSLLTEASSGWHPPFSLSYFIRRITFAKGDPIALACLESGLSVVPSQSDKDEEGNLLTDPFDPRCSEWLVETPVATPIASLPGIETIDATKFSAIAQLDFYMQVQKFYVRHNTSGTILFNEDEILPISEALHEAITKDEGYISVTLLRRYNAPYPRLPFEAISKEQFEEMTAQIEAKRQLLDPNVTFNDLVVNAIRKSQDAQNEVRDINGNAIKFDINTTDIQQDSACDGGACEVRIQAPQM